MAENNKAGNSGNNDNGSNDQTNIGNQQNKVQTGGQMGGSENINLQEDEYTEDLRNSGNRNSSNRKNEDETGR